MVHDPLSQLRDIHLPPAISWWPWAPGWYILATLFVIGVSIFLVRYVLKRQQRLIRRQALTRLNLIKRDYLTSPQFGAEINQLLKQVLIGLQHPAFRANLHGQAWHRLLDQIAPKQHYGKKYGALLESAIYQHHVLSEADTICLATKKWIRKLC